MKKYHIIIAALSLLIASSCSKSFIEAETGGLQGETRRISISREEIADSDGRTGLGDDMVPVWKTGDKIWISDGQHVASATISQEYDGLSSAEISVTGVDFSKKLFASYPYNENNFVYEGSLILDIPPVQEGSFASANIVVGECEPGGSSINFRNATAILKLSFMREDLSSMELCSVDSLVSGLYGIETSTGNANGQYATTNAKIHIDMASGHGAKYIACLPSTLAAGSGFSLVSRDGRLGHIPMTSKNSLKRGVIYDMGSIDERIEFDTDPATDLSAVESANCYIVSGSGSYRIKTCQGNSSESVGEVAFGRVVWETANTSHAPKRFSIVSDAVADGQYLYFRKPEGAPDGNALISVGGKDGLILWSWHIWSLENGVTDQTYSDGGSTFSGAVMMDRNLGALDAGLTAKGYGLLYQCGRKDPFVGSCTLEGSGAAVAGQPMMTVPLSEDTGFIEYATANPYVRITSDTGEWLMEPDNTLWSASNKTRYDPCPAGYHIQYESAFNGIAIGSNSTWRSSYSERGCRTQMGDTYVNFPAAGAKDYSGSSVWFNVGYTGYYWNESTGWRFNSTAVTLRKQLAHGYAASVRCQKNATGPQLSFSLTVSAPVANYVMASPSISGPGYPSASILWGDGSDEEKLVDGSTHTYVESGTYTLTVNGYSFTKFSIRSLGGVSQVDLSSFK